MKPCSLPPAAHRRCSPKKPLDCPGLSLTSPRCLFIPWQATWVSVCKSLMRARGGLRSPPGSPLPSPRQAATQTSVLQDSRLCGAAPGCRADQQAPPEQLCCAKALLSPSVPTWPALWGAGLACAALICSPCGELSSSTCFPACLSAARSLILRPREIPSHYRDPRPWHSPPCS